MNNKSPADTRMQTSAILAISSLDRYTIRGGLNEQLLGVPLLQPFRNEGQPCNSFTIYSGGALIYGYIKKIQIAQTQIQYNIPTVVPNRNDLFFFEFQDNYYEVQIPFGYYSPEELAAVLEHEIRTAVPAGGGVVNPNLAVFTVTYEALVGFLFQTNNVYLFSFAPIDGFVLFETVSEINQILRTYRLLGMDISNTTLANTQQASSNTPVFLYTSYIDIISQILTKYQKVKDTDSSPQKQADIITRIYLAGTGAPQITSGDGSLPLGSRPFTVVQDMNYCKTMRWSRDEAVNSLDFQLKDQYGDLIFQNDPDNTDVYYTEFQMTLLCIEEQD